MKIRNLLAALAVLLGLGAYVYFVEVKGGEKKQKEKEASERVYPEAAERAAEISLARPGETIRLQKEGKFWKILDPAPAATDADAVDRLVRSLGDLRIGRDLGKIAEPASYNLSSPPIKVTVRSEGEKVARTLAIGDEAPTGGGAYARIGDAGNLILVSGAGSIQSTTFLSLRDKTLLKFDPGRLASFRILRGKEEIAFSKVGGKWRVTAPLLAPADDGTVSDLLYALERITAQEFVAEKPDVTALRGRSLHPPRLQVVLSGEEWEGEKRLLFGTVADGSVHALRPESGELVRVSDTAEAKLKQNLDAFRRKDVLPLTRWEIGRLRITGLTPEPLELEKKGESDWTRLSPGKGTLGFDPVDLLLRNFSDLKAVSFVDRPPKNLSKLGFSRPDVKLEFWSRDHPQDPPAVLEVGKKQGKGKLALRDPSWPSILMVEAAAWKTAAAQAVLVSKEKAKEEPVAQTAPASKIPGSPSPKVPSAPTAPAKPGK